MNKEFIWRLSRVLFLCIVLFVGTRLSAIHSIELSRFAFTCHDLSTNRTPAYNPPFVSLPNSYGFQIAVWDSVGNTFNELNNIGLDGMTTELCLVGNILFAAVEYNRFTNITPSMASIYKIDVTNPIDPQTIDTIECGVNNRRFTNMNIVNEKLIAEIQENGLAVGIAVIDINTCEIVEVYEDYLHYEVLFENYLITREIDSISFTILEQNNGILINTCNLNLPYDLNHLPKFIILNEEYICVQTESEGRIYRVDSLAQWVEVNKIEVNTLSRGVLHQQYLIFNIIEGQTSSLKVFNVFQPSSPILANCQELPGDFASVPFSYEMLSVGTYLLYPCAIYGAFSLKIQQDGSISDLARCYQYNDFSSVGHKYNDFILQPLTYDGVVCFDVSDQTNPIFSHTLISNCSSWIDINGRYMIG